MEAHGVTIPHGHIPSIGEGPFHKRKLGNPCNSCTYSRLRKVAFLGLQSPSSRCLVESAGYAPKKQLRVELHGRANSMKNQEKNIHP
ncbi:hypothetical protein JRQ81_019272 [Phrynocephalus forsythii]|uniref:Uncharacterized protein n=1 Tax=Phrynocephalus forsythii TaxID=171643 RepID=A0A9Q1AYC0_9SAUR|nr:hypothetical protein JRQ81_019272 [Phrynocephalus forsythii]